MMTNLVDILALMNSQSWILIRVSTFLAIPTMGFTWDSVGVYSMNASTTNTFQLVLIDRADEGAGNFDMQFRYEDINWTTGCDS